MKRYTDLAMEAASGAGAQYADMRIVRRRENSVHVARRSVKAVDDSESSGYGVRVLVEGSWGFSSSTELEPDAVARTASRAVETAKASARAPKPYAVELAPEPAHVDTCASQFEEDPFEVPNAEKVELLLGCTNAMMDAPDVVMAYGALAFIRMQRVIATSDGSYLDLTNTISVPMMGATAVVGGESQSRSYQGGARAAGYEFVREVNLPAGAAKWAEEAVVKCKADPTPAGVMDLVLDPMHLALTMHESVGHPTELDRILGWEANMAGRSFVRPEDVGSLEYGSGLVNFTADNVFEGGVGSWFYDDDGVKLRSFPMVREGVLVNVGMTRETAPLIGREGSNGCCRSDGHGSFPINRIPNLYLEPGADDSVTPEALIADVERGVYIEGMGSFSIDQMRNNFQFGGDMFWMIERGRVTRPLKKVTYHAQTRQFWRSCDGLAGRPHWRSHGIMNCGKGEPMQVMYMTHGASHARFRDIQVGGAKL
ncbi:MAG: TldD/PmbA family protein [Planctomycetota bacterium]|jgi:TldD protein